MTLVFRSWSAPPLHCNTPGNFKFTALVSGIAWRGDVSGPGRAICCLFTCESWTKPRAYLCLFEVFRVDILLHAANA